MSVVDRAREVANDRDAGAAELLARLLAVLDEALAVDRATTVDVARIVCRGQPAMAPLWHACAAAVADWERPGTFRAARAAMERRPRALVRAATSALQDLLTGERAPLVLTLSYSSSVAATLAALAGDRSLRVICGEGRPRYEGRRLAIDLQRAGADVTIAIDAAVTKYLPSASAVVLGADAVGRDRWINKVGSLGLAAAASLAGKPLYVIAGRDKFAPPPVESHLQMPAGEPEEVWPDAPPGITRSNELFETVPAELVTLFLSDGGPISPADLAAVVSRASDDISLLINSL